MTINPGDWIVYGDNPNQGWGRHIEQVQRVTPSRVYLTNGVSVSRIDVIGKVTGNVDYARMQLDQARYAVTRAMDDYKSLAYRLGGL